MTTTPFLDNPPPPFCLTPPFSGKNFQTPPPLLSILKKSNSPPLYDGGRGPNYANSDNVLQSRVKV